MAQPNAFLDQLRPYAAPGVDVANLPIETQSQLARAIQTMPDSELQNFRITSGYRAPVWGSIPGQETQGDAIRSVAARHGWQATPAGFPGLAAPVGGSNHGSGNAVDLAGVTPAGRAVLGEAGLATPPGLMRSDPVHFEPTDKVPAQAQPQSGGGMLDAIFGGGNSGGGGSGGLLSRLVNGLGGGGGDAMASASGGINPLMMAGLSTMMAGMQGRDSAAAMNQGFQTAAAMRRSAMEDVKMRRELERQRIADELIKGLPNNQAITGALPPSVISAISALPPDQAAKVFGQGVLQQQKGAIDLQQQQKLLQQKRQMDIDFLRQMQPQQAAPRPAPQPGATVQHSGGTWRFKGGDPASPASWERM